MTSLPILLVVVVATLGWLAVKAESRRSHFVPCTAETALHSLRERAARGELTAEEYSRLLALMS